MYICTYMHNVAMYIIILNALCIYVVRYFVDINCSHLILLHRCLDFNENNSTTPEVCNQFYISNTGYFDGGMLHGIRGALNSTYNHFSTYSNTSSIQDRCFQLMEIYLCYFYFPLCKTAIFPTCRSSCNLLFNNEECSGLLMYALSLLEDQNITLLPDNDSCAMTYYSFPGSDQYPVAESCVDIQG